MLMMALRKAVRISLFRSFWIWLRNLPTLSNCGLAATISRPPSGAPPTSKRATAVLSLVTKLFCANLTKALKSVLYPLMSRALISVR